MQPLDVAPEIERTLSSLVDVLSGAFGDGLRSVVLFGSAAEGRMRATSDVNLLVVLRRFDRAHVDRIREPFRFAGAAVPIMAMFVREDEIGDVAREFAQKFADIRRRHRVLFGDDPIAALTIPREALITRLRQVLLNLTLRLRERYVTVSLRQEQASKVIAEAAGPLRTSAASILELERGKVLAPREALETIVRESGDSVLIALLPAISEAREQRIVSNAADDLFAVVRLAEVLSERARQLS